MSYEKKREILQNNIWGVDIDILAVEVAKFSLGLTKYDVETLRKKNINP